MISFFRKTVLGGVFLFVIVFFAAIAFVVYESTGDEAYLKKLLFDDQKNIAHAFFSPDDSLRDILISLINCEKKSIHVAIYTFTDKKIADALLRAVRRGIHVECIVDRSYGSDRHSKVYLLANASLPVWVYRSALEERQASLMHDKFCVFGGSFDNRPLVWTGSYNFTMRAHERNQENIVILDNPRIIERFKRQFDIMKKRSVQISAEIQKEVSNKPESESSWITSLISWI